jgi:hypothetical protein
VSPTDGGSHDTDNIRGPTSSTLSAGLFTLGGHPPPYGQGVSGPVENRAAVFTSQAQDVEVYRNGAWWPGSLLGWRHDADGGCRVWVRLAGDGAEEAWTALEYLRLPEVAPAQPAVRHLSVVDTPARASGDVALTATMAAIRAVPSPGARARSGTPAPSELTATMNLFAVRDLDEDTQAAAAAPAPRSGGRRRAPETDDGAGVPALAAPGRHRAPGVGGGASGRHRAADTGMWPAVRLDDAPESSPSTPVSPDDGADRHLLTRPMRLDDLPGRVPQPRRAALEGRLAGF